MPENEEIQALLDAAKTVRDTFSPVKLAGIEALGMQALMLLQLEGRLGVMAIADRLSASQPNVSTAMRRLVASGHVALRLDPQDSRRREYQLRQHGHNSILDFLDQRTPRRGTRPSDAS